jgi:hypothetical protein
MQALKVDKFCTNQTRVGMGPRMVPFAEKHNIQPAFHTHALSQDPKEISSPASLDQVPAMSKTFMVNLDIGHFANGGNDPLARDGASRSDHASPYPRSEAGREPG